MPEPSPIRYPADAESLGDIYNKLMLSEGQLIKKKNKIKGDLKKWAAIRKAIPLFFFVFFSSFKTAKKIPLSNRFARRKYFPHQRYRNTGKA